MSENSNKTYILSFRQEISSLHFQARVDAPSFEEALQQFIREGTKKQLMYIRGSTPDITQNLPIFQFCVR